jgi:hypothetical protein
LVTTFFQVSAKKSVRRSAKRAKPEGPKRAKTAFFFFSDEKRDEVKEKLGNPSIGQLGKALGEAWKSLSDAEKQPYNDMAEDDKKRYLAEKGH